MSDVAQSTIDDCIAEVARLNDQVSTAVTFLANEMVACKRRVYILELFIKAHLQGAIAEMKTLSDNLANEVNFEKL